MEFKTIDFDNSTEEKVIGTLHENAKIAACITEKLEELKKVSTVRVSFDKEQLAEKLREQAPNVPTKSDKTKEEIIFENEINYYYSQIKKLSPDEMDDQIINYLPTRDNNQYRLIMYRLQAEILRNIKEIKEFMATEELSDEEIGELQYEILAEQEKIRILKSQLTPTIEQPCIQEQSFQKENNLIFVPTTGGNIRVLEEIEHIAPEYYSRFATLFRSIKTNEFKNVVRHANNTELDGLCTVKGFKVRVAFIRLNKDSYAILSAFTQKADNDKTIRTSLASKYMDYKMMEEKLLANLDNEEFIELNKQYENELFEKLSPQSTKAAQLQKKKEGVK